MNTVLITASLASGVYMIVMALLMRTKGTMSAVLFKIIPFFLGLGSLFVGLKLPGWI